MQVIAPPPQEPSVIAQYVHDGISHAARLISGLHKLAEYPTPHALKVGGKVVDQPGHVVQGVNIAQLEQYAFQGARPHLVGPVKYSHVLCLC